MVGFMCWVAHGLHGLSPMALFDWGNPPASTSRSARSELRRSNGATRPNAASIFALLLRRGDSGQGSGDTCATGDGPGRARRMIAETAHPHKVERFASVLPTRVRLMVRFEVDSRSST